MRGILSAAGYVPFRRLSRAAVTEFLGGTPAKGDRAVAGPDEDATTMGVEAARLALRGAPAAAPGALWFSTTTPPFADKTNASAIHAALRLPGEVAAFDFGGGLRSGAGALGAALAGSGTTLVVLADQRDGLPGGADESSGGDGAAALLVGDDGAGTAVVAEHLATASATDEFVDRWRLPGERRSKVWEERFGETRYLALARDAFERACKAAGVEAGQLDSVIVTGMHPRAGRAVSGALGVERAVLAPDLSAAVGQTGTAHPGLVLAHVLEGASPGKHVALVHLADGADVFVFRTTDAIDRWTPARPVADQVAAGSDLPYGKFLAWRQMLTPEPPRRPEPARVSSPAAWRAEAWKFGFVGSRDRASGAVHLPPSRVSMQGGAVDDMEPAAMADVPGTVVTFTVDHLAYSQDPPIVFALVDFDGGGRFPVELTDVDAEHVAIGDRVEMTFRRLYSADGIPDYFWKARPLSGVAADGTD